MNDFLNNVAIIKEFLSNGVFLAVVMFCGIYFSIRMIFPQFRLIKQSFKAMVDTSDSKDGISPFQAFATALGSRVGVGNIAGIASAISIGGPGAIFWIWVFGFFASGLAIAESIAGQIYKIKDKDEYLGGPAFYIEHLFGGAKFSKVLAFIYAVIGVVGIGLFLAGVQSNTVVDSIVGGFNTDKIITIIVTALCVAVIIWGGIKRIGKFEGVFTPIKCFAYLFLAIFTIGYFHENIIPAFVTIFNSAFSLNAIFGGLAYQAIMMGIRRGIFSTDVGYGAGAAFSAVARTDHPVKQGLLQSLSILISTLIICTLSALILMTSDAFAVFNPGDGTSYIYFGQNAVSSAAGATWIQAGLNSVPILNGWAPKLIACLIAIFAAGTIIGYYYLAENNLRYIMRKIMPRAEKKFKVDSQGLKTKTKWIVNDKIVVNALKIIFLAGMIFSTFISPDAVWDFADIGLAVLCWINLFCLIIMSPKIIKVINDYSRDLRKGITPKFDPADYGFEDTTGAWK
ncbi:MAG: alanine/glycine:cation symporter family protein [Coriobacteriia bacterium]|nr:alanine/glycine:cation symporter family protein [Coriobacteriia bacterium]